MVESRMSKHLAGEPVGVTSECEQHVLGLDSRGTAGASLLLGVRGDRRIEPAHILLAVLNAREGTVPRALRGAGVAPGQVIAEAQAAMDRA